MSDIVDMLDVNEIVYYGCSEKVFVSVNSPPLKSASLF